jgi:hypothetical protein
MRQILELPQRQGVRLEYLAVGMEILYAGTLSNATNVDAKVVQLTALPKTISKFPTVNVDPQRKRTD